MGALERDGHRCRECGKAGVLEVHHVESLEDGGEPYEVGNLLTLCRGCHMAAHGKAASPERRAWRRLVERL